MGDAKKRGTFERRQSESVAREQGRVRSLPPRRRVNPKSAVFMAGIAGILANSNSRVMDALYRHDRCRFYGPIPPDKNGVGV